VNWTRPTEDQGACG